MRSPGEGRSEAGVPGERHTTCRPCACGLHASAAPRLADVCTGAELLREFLQVGAPACRCRLGVEPGAQRSAPPPECRCSSAGPRPTAGCVLPSPASSTSRSPCASGGRGGGGQGLAPAAAAGASP